MGEKYSRPKDLEVNGVVLRKCNFCNESLNLENFPKNKSCASGRESSCKVCRKKRVPKEVRERMLRSKSIYGKKKYNEDIEASREKGRLAYKSGAWPSTGKAASRKVNRKNRAYHIEYINNYEASEKSKLKHRKKIEEWRIKNKKKSLAHSKVYHMIATGKIKKPLKCPSCEKKTNSRKMYLRLDENLDYKNPHWLCSFCSGTQTISENIKKGLD